MGGVKREGGYRKIFKGSVIVESYRLKADVRDTERTGASGGKSE